MRGRVSRVMQLLAVAIISLSLLEIQASESPEFTLEQKFRTHNGTLLVQSGSITGGMFKVSMTNRTIDIEPASSSAKSCKNIVIDPFEDAIEGEIRATLVETHSNKKIVVWGVERSEIVKSSRIISYKMLLIDLDKCESKALQLPDEQIPSQRRILLPEVQVGHNDQKFNVYFASQRNCSPCEVDAYGLVSSPNNQLPNEGSEPADNFHLRPLYDGSSYGYFYAFNLENYDRAIVKLLGVEYKARKIRYLDDRVDVVSVKSGRIRNVGYCYQSIKAPIELRCERLDSRLRSRASVLVPLDQPARKFSLVYDEQANFFVAVALNAQVRVFVYAIYGELLATLDFGSLQETDNVRDLSAFVDADQYCLFYSIQQQASNDTNNAVQCINKTRYFEQSYF